MRTLCVGEALVDLVCERPVASISEADAFVPRFGGAIANVAVTAARRGADVALAGGVGTDAWGAWLHQRLADEGVDLTWFDRRDDGGVPFREVVRRYSVPTLFGVLMAVSAYAVSLPLFQVARELVDWVL